MPTSELHTEQREFTVCRDVPVLRISLTEKEVGQILVAHVLKTEVAKRGLSNRQTISASADPDIHWSYEEYQGYQIEIVFEEEG